MGAVSGDHKIISGKTPTGKVVFCELPALNGERCMAMVTSHRVAEVDAYEGHILLSDETGKTSPRAFPLSFSVGAGKDDKALALIIVSAAQVGNRMLMAAWDGQTNVPLGHTSQVTSMIKNFGNEDHKPVNEQHDPSVVRTALGMKFFMPKQRGAGHENNKVIVPNAATLGARIGDSENAFKAQAVVKRMAGPANKVSGTPILAPMMDSEAAVSALCAIPDPTVQQADFYGGAGVPEGDVRRSDRIQAARSFPVLAGIMADSREMRNAIDERGALQPLVIEATGLSKGALKRLSKITEPLSTDSVMNDGYVVRVADQFGANRLLGNVVRGGISLDMALEQLRELPPEWTPDNNKAWKAYADILGGLAIPLSSTTGISVKELLGASKGDWVSFKATLAKAADIPVEEFDRLQMATLAGEIIGMMDNFARTAVLPMFANVLRRANELVRLNTHNMAEVLDSTMEKAMVAVPSIIIGKSKNPLAALLETERRYISRDAAINALRFGEGDAPAAPAEDAVMGNMAKNKEFPVVRPTFTASNGYRVQPFENEAQMQEEGTLMGHCVGTFHTTPASNGDYHYFAVYHPDKADKPKTRGTLRIQGLKTGGKIMQIEFRSHHNGNVSKECQTAYDEWEKTFLQEDIDAAAARVAEWVKYRKDHGIHNAAARALTPEERWENVTGVSIASPETANNLWREWAENVLTGWSADSPEVLFRSAPIRDALRDLSTKAAEMLVTEAAERKAAAELNQAMSEPAGP